MSKRILIIVNNAKDDDFEIYNLEETDFDPKELQFLKELHNNHSADLMEWFNEFIDTHSSAFDQWDIKNNEPLQIQEPCEIYYIIKK